ncbi:MAG: hypothetical protein KBF33_12810 [Comamonas sp.]|nr:hypothetical protein [Comamonas sp.]
MFFDPKFKTFLHPDVHEIPDRAIQISTSQYSSLLNEQASGKIIEADVDGNPIAINPPKSSISQILDVVKTQMRGQRAPMLDALSGIAGRSERAAKRFRQEQAQAVSEQNTDQALLLAEQITSAESLAAEADALAQALLDITDDPALNAAQTLEDMQAAGVAAYRAIAVTASAELAVVFKEHTGV